MVLIATFFPKLATSLVCHAPSLQRTRTDRCCRSEFERLDSHLQRSLLRDVACAREPNSVSQSFCCSRGSKSETESAPPMKPAAWTKMHPGMPVRVERASSRTPRHLAS